MRDANICWVHAVQGKSLARTGFISLLSGQTKGCALPHRQRSKAFVRGKPELNSATLWTLQLSVPATGEGYGRVAAAKIVVREARKTSLSKTPPCLAEESTRCYRCTEGQHHPLT